MDKKKQIIITGATGFLGARLLDKLLTKDFHIIAVSRSKIPNNLKKQQHLQWVIGDISEKLIFQKIKLSVDCIIHLAGATLGSNLDEQNYIKANELTLNNLLNEKNITTKKIIFTSSQVIYGDKNSKNIKEDSTPGNIDSAYSASKINTENWLKWHQRKLQIPVIALRMSGFIEGGGIIDYIIKKAIENKEIELFSKGNVFRDYLPVKDGISSILSALNMDFKKEYHAINIGSGNLVTTKEIAERIVSVLGSSSRIIDLDKNSGRGNCILNITKAKNILGFNPQNIMSHIDKYALSKIK